MPIQEAPITSSVLRWAIQESGLSVEQVASRIGATTDELAHWQDGTAAPTRGQLNALAHTLRRSTAIFFLEKPPTHASVDVSFRAAFGDLKRDLTGQERHLIRYAQGVQSLAHWSRIDSAPAALPTSDFEADPEEVAAKVRDRLGVKVFHQRGWRDASDAFEGWRHSLEAVGVIVLQLDLGPNAVRGFSLAATRSPLVAVNTSYAYYVRTFTAFHEVAHLITRSSSACLGFAAPLRHVNRIERWCERFAASFLLPASGVRSFLEQHRPRHEPPGLDEVRALSKSFHVSARAAAIRLIDLKLADASLYVAVDVEWKPHERDDRRGGRAALTPLKRLRQVGRRVASGIQTGIGSGQITTLDALRYLDLTLGEYEDFSKLAASEP